MSESDFSHVPDGYHSVTPSLTVSDANAALDFYVAAFGATVNFKMPDESSPGKLMHAEFAIGNSTIMISDEYPDLNCTAPEVGKGGAFMIYVADADAAFAQAIEAGATEIAPVEEQFWGDKMGRVADPFGYRWSIAQKVRDVADDEIAEGAKTWTEENS